MFQTNLVSWEDLGAAPVGSPLFSMYARVAKSYEGPAGSWIIEGPLSSPGMDLQGEKMDMAGLQKGLATFDRLKRPVDWEHLYEKTRDPDYLIGKGIGRFNAPHPETGIDVPWLRAELYQNKEFAKKARNHLEAGGDLGFSVAGIAKSRAPYDPAVILEPIVTSVAVTPVPVVAENAGCIRLVKSLSEVQAALRSGPAGLRQVRELRFPVVAETAGQIPWGYVVQEALAKSFAPEQWALLKALEATPGLPHVGPGLNALAVEDLHGARRKKKKAAALADEEQQIAQLSKNLPGVDLMALILACRLAERSFRR